jgi:spore coat protein H
MSKRSWAAAATVFLAAGVALVAAEPPAAKETPGKDVFGLTKVWKFNVELSAKEHTAMQPAGGMRGPGGFGPGGPRGPGGPGGPGGERPAEKPADKPGEPAREVHKGSGFGIEFPWAHGAFTAEGKTFKDVGVRYKGNASYMASAMALKRNLKIDFDRYDEDNRFHGLKTLNLNAGAMDPTKGHEVLSYAVFRDAGVPAPRTAFAEVTLTVPGKHDKEFLGLYTVVEQVDKTFLKDRFKNNKGLLMKPERLRGLEYLGDDWAKYKDRYGPKHEPTEKEAQRVIAFAKLVNRGSDEQFKKEIDSYLDVDEFLRFVAVNALLVNLDSFLTLGHNYYIYLNPETNKFVFIPWDLDLSLGGFPMMGSPEQQLDLSLMHPHAGENKLIDRLLAIKEVNEKYRKLLKELATTVFTKERLLKDIAAIETTTKEIMEREKKAVDARKEGGFGRGFGPPMMGRSPDLRTFVEKRTELVMAQLDGKSKGFVPGGMGFGPGGPGGFGGFPQPGQILPPPLQDMLQLTSDQKKQLETLQKEVDAKLEKLLTDDQKKQLKAMREGPGRGGFGPPPGGPGGFGPPGGPGGFGPPRERPEEPRKDDKKEEQKP